jgi:hypothetical protein
MLEFYLAELKDEGDKWGMASQFLRALSDTDGVLHGGPHTRNVIVRLVYDRPWLTLIDFGTSRFTRSDKFVERHW